MKLNIQSQQLLQSAFGSNWLQAWVEWWKFDQTTGKVDPSTHRWERAGKANPPEDHAVYFCVSAVGEGLRRSLEGVGRNHVVVLDDVGTKLDREMVDVFLPLPPTFVVETSKGNFQYLWVCEEGLTVTEFRRVRAGMEAIFGPSDCNSPAHLVRLPMGVNGKPGRVADVVRLVRAGDVACTAAESIAAFPAAPGAERGEGGGEKATVEAVRRLLAVLPNDGVGEWCASYQAWIYVGMAIKGALGEEGRALWLEWCAAQPQVKAD